MPTTLDIDRDDLRDALVGAAYRLGTIKPDTSGAKRQINHIAGLFNELVEQIDAQIEAENGADSVSESDYVKDNAGYRRGVGDE